MSQENRDVIVEGLIPESWNKASYDWAITIRNFLDTIPGVVITGSGCGSEVADCSFKCEGAHFWVEVRQLQALQ